MATPVDVEEYFMDVDPDRRDALQRVRALIKKTIPDIRETMCYRMPTYEREEVDCALASQKNYMSLYMDVDLVEEERGQLNHLDVGKSCNRFKHIEELPLDVIEGILTETVKNQAKS